MPNITSTQIIVAIALLLLGFGMRYSHEWQTTKARPSTAKALYMLTFSIGGGLLAIFLILEWHLKIGVKMVIILLSALMGSEFLPGVASIRAVFFKKTFEGVIKNYANKITDAKEIPEDNQDSNDIEQ